MAVKTKQQRGLENPFRIDIKYIEKLFLLLVAGISLLLILSHLLAVILGFYYTGDTISSLETTFAGRPLNFLQVFNSYYQVWPPGMGFFYSALRILPISLISQQHVYVVIVFFLNLAIGYLIVNKLTRSKLLKIILLALIFFGGSQEFLFHTAMSEPLFIFFWFLTIFSIERFVSTMKERHLLLFIFAGIGLTMSRYSALSILMSLLIFVWRFVYFTYHKKKYSLTLVFMTSIVVWIPIVSYLLRNKLTDNRFFGLHDAQFASVTIIDVINQLTPGFTQDITILVIISLFIGMKIAWDKHVKYFFWLSGGSMIVYLFFLYYGLLTYRFQDGFHSRLLAISYPELSLAALGLGSFIVYKFPKIQKLAIYGLIIAVLYLSYQNSVVLNRTFNEPEGTTSLIKGTEYSQDIRSVCQGKRNNKFLLIQGSSRNWTGQSLVFYCKPIEVIDPKSLPKTIPANSLIYSAYPLSDFGLTPVESYDGEKKIFLYETKSELKLTLSETLKALGPLD